LPRSLQRPEVEALQDPATHILSTEPTDLMGNSVPPILLGLFLLPLPGMGQTAGRLPRVLELPASARALALGNAYMTDTRDADALFYHPGLLADAEGYSLEVQTWREASAASAAFATPWHGFGVALGLQVLQFGLPSSDEAPSGQDHLFRPGEVPASERVASLGFGRAVGGFRWGLTGKLAEERVGASRDAFTLLDIGVARELGPFQLGLTYQGLSGGGDRGWKQPARLTLAAGRYGEPVGIFDLGASAAVSRRGDGEVLAGVGLEVAYWPVNGRTFLGRMGLQRVPDGDGSPVSFGLAFWGDTIALEWAFRPFGGEVGGGTHRFGLRWR
jgi:hypothetical protein